MSQNEAPSNDDRKKEELERIAAICMIENYGRAINVSGILDSNDRKGLDDFQRLGQASLASMKILLENMKEAGFSVPDALIEEVGTAFVMKSPKKPRLG